MLSGFLVFRQAFGLGWGVEGTRKGICVSRQVTVLGWGGERLEKASVSRRSFGAGKDGRRCGEEFAFLVRLKRKGTVRAKSERRIKARGFTRGRKLAGYRNLGRKRKRLQAAHRRATLEINCVGRIFRFSSSFW